MRSLRSIPWALLTAPALFFAAGCENNEKGVDTKGTTTSPTATTSTEEMLKRGTEAAKTKVAPPAGYPGAGGAPAPRK